MPNKNIDNAMLARISEASTSFTKESINRIIKTCDSLLQDELPAYVKEALAEVDSECCRLLRDRRLLAKLTEYALNENEDKCCMFDDVYAKCTETVNAICMQEGVTFNYSKFIPDYKISMSSDDCCSLILLPIAIALEHGDCKKIRLIPSLKYERIELEYMFPFDVPPVGELAAECLKTDRSSGLYFAETLLAYNLETLLERIGGTMRIKKNKLTLVIPKAPKKAVVNSAAPPYIDNRFSPPYIMLAKIVRREI